MISGNVTEMRFRKDKYSVKEIKDVFKTPLGVVAEKRKQIKLKFDPKKD